MSDENILAKIGGDYVAAMLKTLPPCETAKDDIQETVIEVPRFGRVCFTCKRTTGRNRKHQWLFWTAIKAVKVE